MGDDIGSDSVTGCRLSLLGDHRRQTELHYLGWAKNKQMEPKPMPSPNNYPALGHRPVDSKMQQ